MLVSCMEIHLPKFGSSTIFVVLNVTPNAFNKSSDFASPRFDGIGRFCIPKRAFTLAHRVRVEMLHLTNRFSGGMSYTYTLGLADLKAPVSFIVSVFDF